MDSTSTTRQNSYNTSNESRPKTGQNRFVLTHSMGQKLNKEAFFYVDGSVWKLDYRNGDIVYYQIQSGDESNPLCGINAVDNSGDRCEICISKSGDDAKIEFKYNEGTLVFMGYNDR